MFKRTLSYLSNDGKNTQLYDQLFDMLKDKLDYSSSDDSIYAIIKYAIYFGNEDAKKFIEDKAKEFSNVKKYYEAIKRDFERLTTHSKVNSTNARNNGVYTVRLENPIDHLEFEYAIAPNGDIGF
jgi:hypothetical protein